MRMRSRVLHLLVAILALGASASPAAADWQSSLERTCEAHRGVSWTINLRFAQNMATCTQQCYGYTLVCKDGTGFPIVSRYPPGATDSEIFMYENSGSAILVKLLAFVAVAFFGGAAAFGSKRVPRDRAVVENGAVVAAVGLTLYAWGTGHVEEYHSSLGRFLDFAVGYPTLWLVVPLFVAINGAAFVRGFHYLFTTHPASGLVFPGLSAGGSIDIGELAHTLSDDAADEGAAPAYRYGNQAEKARALTDRLEAENAAMDAKIARAKARIEFEQAERELSAAKRRQARNEQG
jgi:hypothetical protein